MVKVKPYYQDDAVTIYHGDCREILPGLPKVDLVLTDPPYGTKTSQQDTFMIGEFSNVMPLVLPQLHAILKDDGGFYCFTSWSMMSDWLLRYQQYFKLQNIIIWDKQKHSGCYSSQSWQFTWEGIFFGLKGKRSIRKYMPDVIKSTSQGKRNAMEKPVDIICKLIEASTDEGDIILDPFLGRGNTAIASITLNRKCIGIEIEEKYCEIATNRCRQMVMEL